MRHNRQGVDKATFKQIFRDPWEPFQQRYPRYRQPEVQAVIDKMLGCGDPASGYIAEDRRRGAPGPARAGSRLRPVSAAP
jgi:hypothetical protein